MAEDPKQGLLFFYCKKLFYSVNMRTGNRTDIQSYFYFILQKLQVIKKALIGPSFMFYIKFEEYC